LHYTIYTLRKFQNIASLEFLKMLESLRKMKKFEIKKTEQNQWLVSHNEFPRFTCLFEDKKFHYSRTITGLLDPTGSPEEIQLLQKMEKWLSRYHMDKING